MQINGMEKELLRELSKRLIMQKHEIVTFLSDKAKDNSSVVEQLIKNLSNKGLVASIAPIGNSCIAITKQGVREADK